MTNEQIEAALAMIMLALYPMLVRLTHTNDEGH